MMSSYSDRLDRSLNILENITFELNSDFKLNARKTRLLSFEHEQQACVELSILLTNLDSLGSVGNQQISREKLSRSIAVLFKIINHPEQGLRFLADQILDEIFRKFILKFQAPKVIAYLLTEFDKKSPARILCSVLQKLSWVAVYTKSQRADVYNSHFLCGMIQCIKKEDDSVQMAIQRYFPLILDSFGPFICATHTELATELFNAAINNLNSRGGQNRAASIVINHLAKFVPSILHKSIYQLAEIILNGDDNDEQHQHRLSGALNTFSILLPFVLENMTQTLAFLLKKLLCRVLCCLYSRANEVVLASLEFLQKFVSKHQQFKDAINQLAQFDPRFIQLIESEEGSLNSPVYFVEEQKASCSKSFENKLEEVETMSCFSLRTDYSSSRPASAWNSLQDLLAEQQMSVSNSDQEIGHCREQSEASLDDTGGIYPRNDDNLLEIDDFDKISVSSAELFVDPLMNCLHQQQKSERLNTSSWLISNESKTLKSNDGTITTRTNTTSGFITPISIISRSIGQKSFENQQQSEEYYGILEFLPNNFCNTGVNFWIYSALFVARKFLLASKGRIRSNREIRVSHKILALNYIAETLLLESSLIQQPILDVDVQHNYLTDLHLYIGHDDDNLAIAALNFFFNVEKCSFFNDPSQFNQLFSEKSKLIWYIKKTLHCQRNSTRLKGIFQMFINAIPLLCYTDSLLMMACEYAININAEINYFRVKAVRAEFLSKIKWSQTSLKIRQKLQVGCTQVFVGQLFDKDPRVHKSTLEFLPLFVLNADFGQNTNFFAYFSLPHCLKSTSGLPLIIGLNDNLHSYYQTKSVIIQKILSENFLHIFNKIYSLTMEQFFVQKSGFIFSLEVLINNFPLNYFHLITEKRSSNISPKDELSVLYSLLLLLLDFAEDTTCSLEELGSIVRIITKLFSEISIFLINQNNIDQLKTANTTSKLLQFWNFYQLINVNAKQIPKSKQNTNCIERCLMLYLRILNLFYSIVAEEKVQRHKILLHRTGLIAEGFVSNAAFLLANPSSLILPEKSSDYFSSTAKSLSNTTIQTTTKAKNLSFLLGAASSHPNGRRQPTSYLNSFVLSSLEMQLRNAYKAFLESLKPDSHCRFLDLFNSTMNGFCTFLEFADFSLIQTFIDELLIFLRMLMDISPDNSARLVSHLIKNAFNINYLSLKPKHSNSLRQNDMWQGLSDYTNDPIEFNLLRPIYSFNNFIKFAHRSEFSELLIDWMAGWMHSSRMKLPLIVIQEDQQEQMNQLLHQFEPFISRLLKLYPLTNSKRTKKSIFDCIFVLCLCNVRYELLDANGKFKARVLLQLKQLSPEEDVSLLPSMFMFISLVVRVRCLKSSEIGLVIEELFKRIDSKILFWSLESLKIVIFDIISQNNRKTRISEEHKLILIQLKDGLLKIFTLTFQHYPEQAAEVWLCLFHAFKANFDYESLSNMSSDFITHYFEFYNKISVRDEEFTTPQHSPTRETTPQIDANEQYYSFLNLNSNMSRNNQNNFCPNPLRQIFLHSILISQCCVSSTSSKIDDFLKCLDKLLKQLINDSQLLVDNYFVNLALYVCPMIFILFNHIEEEKLLNFCSTHKGNDENSIRNLSEEAETQETFLEFLAKHIAFLVFHFANNVCCTDFLVYTNSDDTLCSQNNYIPSAAEAVLLFLILTLCQSIQSENSSHLICFLKKHLCIAYNNLPKNVYVKLAHCSPSIWSFWMNFHFTFSKELSFSDFGALPSKCKYLLVQLLFLKINQFETELEIETLFISVLDSLTSFSSKTDFLLEFLRVEGDKLFKKCINKLPKRVLNILEIEFFQIFNQNWGEDVIIPSHELCSLLPRLFYILAKSENVQTINLLTKINEIDESNSLERFKIIWAHFTIKPEQQIFNTSNLKFTNKEFSILHDNNVSITQFYKILLLHSSTANEFEQICEAILTLGEQEIDDILYNRPFWPLSKKFFESFFLVLTQNIVNYNEENEINAKIEKIIQVLVKHCFIKNKKRNHFPAESVFILAKIDDLRKNFQLQILHFSLFLSDNKKCSVECFLNHTFVQLFTSYYSNDEELPSEFYVALKLFFSLQIVKDYYADNDCKTLKSLLLFFTLFWELIEKKIERWKRPNIDKRHLSIQIEIILSGDERSSFSDYWQIEEKDDLEEGIKKLFSLIQRIVFSLKNDLIENEEAKEAFISLLANVSLFHRMALIPESALRQDWKPLISINNEGNCSIPLVQIYLLNDLAVLQDFCFRLFSFGWSSRSQFEEFSMSLFGVLSSTPTTLFELQQKTEADGINTVYQQLYASSLAVEALSGVLLQSLLYPKPGDIINSNFVVIHRKRKENFLFLNTEFGKVALRAKLLTNLLIENDQIILNNATIFIENLEFNNSKKRYGLGQAALYHLWSVTGLLEPSSSPSFSSIFYTQETEPTIELNKVNDEYDTSSSIRALFETFIHWLNSSEFISHLPLSILHSTLRSLSLLSDLFQEKTFYKQTYSTIKTLLANNPKLFTDPTCKGFTYFLLLKCASVLDWAELADSGEVSTSKYIESIIHSGFLNQNEKFVQICSLYGLLYLLQSLALENLHNIMSISFDFVVRELKQQRQNGTLDCFILYQKLCWAFAFGILQEAVPLNENSRDQLLQLIKIMFVNPQLPDWLILILTRGIESLVLHSCCYAFNFRMIALEYFDIYQLFPGHLPYALSLYFTCAYRELNEGGEFTYAFNKNFGEDFLKILNIFSFYSNSSSSSKVVSMCHLLSDLFSFIWAKEIVLECLWTVLMPPLTPLASPRKPISSSSILISPQNENNSKKIASSGSEFSDPLQSKEIYLETFSSFDDKPLLPRQLILSKFDQFLVQLIFFIMRKLYKTDKKVCFELMINFFIPKLMNRIENSTGMLHYLTLCLLCSTAINETESKRVHILFQSNPFDSKFFKAVFYSDFIFKLINDFLNELDILNINEEKNRSKLFEFFILSLSLKNV